MVSHLWDPVLPKLLTRLLNPSVCQFACLQSGGGTVSCRLNGERHKASTVEPSWLLLLHLPACQSSSRDHRSLQGHVQSTNTNLHIGPWKSTERDHLHHISGAGSVLLHPLNKDELCLQHQIWAVHYIEMLVMAKINPWRQKGKLFPSRKLLVYLHRFSQAPSHVPHPAPGFPGPSVEKNPPASPEDTREAGSIPGSGRSPGVGNGIPL